MVCANPHLHLGPFTAPHATTFGVHCPENAVALAQLSCSLESIKNLLRWARRVLYYVNAQQVCCEL